MIKATILVFTEIQRKTSDPSFKISQGGANLRLLSNFLKLFEKEFGNVTRERLVDFCICTSRAFRNRDSWTISQIFGPASIKRLRTSQHRARYFEDKWLKENGLTRAYLINLIADRNKHPLSKYIYMKSEEQTKSRFLNTEIGFGLCLSSTLGWSPLSESCSKCKFKEQCEIETEKNYPELYRIRKEENGRERN